MAIPQHKLQQYVASLSKRLDITPDLVEKALLRKGRMPNPSAEMYRAANNFDQMGYSGMPEQATLKNFYLDELDITGSGQPRSSLKPGNIQELAPQAKPLNVQPPAAPRPTAAPTPTKVSTTRAPAGNMASAVRTSGMPGTGPGYRVAGQAVEANPGLFGGIFDDVWGKGTSQAKDAVKGVTQGANKASGAANGLIRGNAGRIIGGGGVLAALSAASEFADTEDPLMRNASQAVGNFGGGLSGAAGGALLGGAIGSIVPIVGTGIGATIGGFVGGMGGSNVGSNIGGGLYDMFNNTSPEQRARDQMVNNANVQRSIAMDDVKAQMLLQKDAMLMKRNDDFARQDRDLQVQNEYNYANMINQAVINAQANSSLQQQAIAQAMMG